MDVAGIVFLGIWVIVYINIEYIVYPIVGRIQVKSSDLITRLKFQACTRRQTCQLKALVPLGVKTLPEAQFNATFRALTLCHANVVLVVN
ncbi:unnamed protein product, partial [Allacma fusca]